MSTTTAVDAYDSSSYFGTGAAKTSTSTNNAYMNMETFLKLLTVQLSNQNPLEPMSDRDFFAQMAQLGQVQGMETLNKSSEMQQAQSLMGKTVTASRDAVDVTAGKSATVTGIVSGMSVKNGVYYLNVMESDGGTVDVKMSSLTNITPNPDVASYNSLIGKYVAGTGSYTSNGKTTEVEAVGQVVGVSASNGVVYAQVKTTDYGTIAVPVNKLEHIATSTE